MEDRSRDGGEVGVFSYAQILHLLKIEFARARRYQYQLSCVLVEIDRLGSLGDLHGSAVRDQLDRSVTDLLNRYSRSCDFVGRLGERFVIVLPHTEAKGAELLAHRLHDRIAGLDVRIDGRLLRVSASIAVATHDGDDSIFFDAVLKRAETALQAAVARGGDTVVVAE